MARMQQIWITYMVYKARVCNGINYATAAWWTKERAEKMKSKMLLRDDIEAVFIQELFLEEDAPQKVKEQNGHIAQHSNGAEPQGEICAHHIPKGECAFHPGIQCKSNACKATPRKLRHC